MRNVASIEPPDKSRPELTHIAMDRYAFYWRLTRSSYLMQRATIDGFVNVLIRGITKLLYQAAYVRPDIRLFLRKRESARDPKSARPPPAKRPSGAGTRS